MLLCYDISVEPGPNEVWNKIIFYKTYLHSIKVSKTQNWHFFAENLTVLNLKLLNLKYFVYKTNGKKYRENEI